MKKNGYIAAMGVMAILSEIKTYDKAHKKIPNRHITGNLSEPKKVIPKGCQEYFFLKSGRFVNEKPSDTYPIIYECVAASDKSAERKFSNWKSRHKFT